MLRVVILAATLMVGVPQALAQTEHREAADAPERAGDSEDRIVCKKFQKIGSLVASYKTCKSVKEWRRERENIRSSQNIGACGGVAEGGMCAN